MEVMGIHGGNPAAQTFARLPLPRIVTHEITADAQGICKKLQRWFQRGAVFPDPQERLLYDVVREVDVPSPGKNIPEYGRLVPLEKHLESLLVGVSHVLEELFV